jgi:hypothetical protein
MGNFKIPLFQYIINNDSQATLKADKAGTISNYAAGTDLSPADATHLFAVEGELGWVGGDKLTLLAASTRIRKQVWAAAVKGIKAYTVSSTAAAAGDVFRIVYDSFDKSPTAYQNIPLEKRYQISAAKASTATIVANMAAVINADANAPVIAYAGHNNAATPTQDDSAKLVLVAKDERVTFDLYSSKIAFTAVAAGTTVYHTAEDTSAVTVASSNSVNDYENLKNKQWVTDLDFDRNAEYFPEKGAKYNSYFFEVNWTQDTGGDSVPGQVAVSGKSQFMFYVKQGLALDTAMDAMTTDMNV